MAFYPFYLRLAPTTTKGYSGAFRSSVPCTRRLLSSPRRTIFGDYALVIAVTGARKHHTPEVQTRTMVGAQHPRRGYQRV